MKSAPKVRIFLFQNENTGKQLVKRRSLLKLLPCNKYSTPLRFSETL